jgi:large subunit ribosomal protein L13e
MTSAVANRTPNVLEISTNVKDEKPRAVTSEEKEFSAYGKIRVERMNLRQVGPRFVHEREEAEKAAAKVK